MDFKKEQQDRIERFKKTLENWERYKKETKSRLKGNIKVKKL